MYKTGLVSITFRKLNCAEIIDLVARAGLQGIEWGGDVHVPHGDLAIAREVKRQTEDAGLAVSSYGSYYRLVASEEDGLAFQTVLDSAVELGVPAVRVWAGNRGSADADSAYWAQVVAEARRIGDLADSAGIDVAFEFHGGTLTDTNASARALLEESDHNRIKSYWQPPAGMSDEDCLQGLAGVLPWLTNVHAFHWDPDFAHRCALAEGRARWRRFLQAAAQAGGDRWVLLEFVKDDSPEQFLADSAALREMVAE